MWRKVGNQVLFSHSRCFGSYFDVIFLMYLLCLLAVLSRGLSSQPHYLINHPHRPSLAKSGWWVCRKVVVKTFNKSKSPCDVSSRPGLEAWHWTFRALGRGFASGIRPSSGTPETPATTHHLCGDDWLAQFRLTNVHKGGLKTSSFPMLSSLIFNKFRWMLACLYKQFQLLEIVYNISKNCVCIYILYLDRMVHTNNLI